MLHQMNAGKLVICHHRLILLATNFQNLVLDSVSFKFVFLISFTKDPPPTLTFAVVSVSLPPANEVWGKDIFLHLSAILFTPGGVCLSACRHPPRSRHPPPEANTPLGADTPLPRSRQPPQEQTLPWEQTPPRADTPGTKYTPLWD